MKFFPLTTITTRSKSKIQNPFTRITMTSFRKNMKHGKTLYHKKNVKNIARFLENTTSLNEKHQKDANGENKVEEKEMGKITKEDEEKVARQTWSNHIRLESSRALDREVDHAIQNLFVSPLDMGHDSLDLSTPVFETFQREVEEISFETLRSLSEVEKVMIATRLSFMHRLYQRCIKDNKSIFLKFVKTTKDCKEIFTTPLFLSRNAYELENEYAIPIEVISIKNESDGVVGFEGLTLEWEDIKRLRTQFVHFMILTRGMAGGVTPTNSIIHLDKIHSAALYAPYMEALLFKNVSALTDQQFQQWIKGNQTLCNVTSELSSFTSSTSNSYPLWDPRQASLSVYEGHSYINQTPYYFGDLEE